MKASFDYSSSSTRDTFCGEQDHGEVRENGNSDRYAPCSGKVSKRGIGGGEAMVGSAAGEAGLFDTPMIHSKRRLQKFLRCA